MKDYKQLLRELPSSTIVCAVGDFDPPTVAHEQLVKTVKRLAEEKHSAHLIFTKNGVLQEEKKSQYLSLMFPKTNFKSLDESFQETVSNLKKKYKNVIVVSGTAQMNALKKGLKESVEFIAITERDPDANESKMKSFATKALFEEFKKRLPTTVRELDGKRLMNDVRQGMGLEPIKEQINLVKDTLREKYFRGEIFNIGDIVEAEGKPHVIVKRGSNHLLLKEESGKLVSKWIQDVKLMSLKEHIHTHQHTQVQHNSDHKAITHGDAFSLKIGKEHHQNIFDLEHGDHHVFKCMDGKEWHAVRHGSDVHFVAHPDDVRIHTNYHPKVPHAHFTGEVEYGEPERPTFQTIFASGETMVKEAAIQPNGTDKIETNGPESSGQNEAPRPTGVKKGFLTFYNYKLSGQTDDKNLSKNGSMNSVSGENTAVREETLAELSNELLQRYKDKAMKSADVLAAAGKHSKANDRYANHMKASGKQISTTMGRISKTLKLKETALNPLDPHGDYKAKSKALQDIQMDPHTHKDPELTAELMRSKAALEKEYEPHRAKLKEETDKKDTITVDIPLMIRILELAREDIKSDPELHKVVERLINIRNKGVLSMDDYSFIANIKEEYARIVEEKPEEKADRIKQLKRFRDQVAGVGVAQDRPGMGTETRPFNDPFFKEEYEVTDADLEELAESAEDEDYLSLYDADEVALIWEDTGELVEDEQFDLMEVLSRSERFKSKIRFRRTDAKRKRAKKIAIHRHSPTKTINSRARRLAIRLMKKRLLRGRDYSQVGIGDKERIDKTIQSRKKVIDRLAAKLVTRVRGVERSRMSHDKFTKGDQPKLF